VHHCSDEAGEFRDLAGEERLPIITIAEIAENLIKRVFVLALRRGSEERRGLLGPSVSRRDRERLLAFEMMKERVLGHTRFDAEVVDAGRGITFRADQRHGRLDQLFAADAGAGSIRAWRSTGRYSAKGNIALAERAIIFSVIWRRIFATFRRTEAAVLACASDGRSMQMFAAACGQIHAPRL
jgi:hypothetical protein